ncbi:MAG: radical SAM family heme chaperone HemW [Zoogloeaceae bacterium]|jgi:oxygen-independent coproporphyrinogen-3 oxidase|nr:radical SAM family heme chaperone HemW [Zoogloeaceae bacterium]
MIALYIHLPWCVRKCPYCDFNSYALKGVLPEDDYLKALLADLDMSLPQIPGRTISSVFMGGGTPSLFSAGEIGNLLTGIRARLPLADDIEITLEANPGALDSGAEKLAAFRAAGVNRLSLGIQSFNDERLAALGRIHGRAAALEAAGEAVRHFGRVNLDLMYGLPGETLAEAVEDVETALEFSPTHLSCYALTLEAHTRFAANPPPLPDADCCADMNDAIAARLAAAGFAHYETSAFARPGYSCQHNLNYWRFGDYLGLGAGAHSKISRFSETGEWQVVRETRPRHPGAYLRAVAAGNPARSTRVIPAKELPLEFLMNALRLEEGFTSTLYERRTGLSFAALLPRLQNAVRAGLLDAQMDCVAPTPLGRNFLNRLLRDFLD